MTPKPSQDGNESDDSAKHAGLSNPSLFVGSFNINSSNLTKEAAKAWLAKAVNADIVALGLQECATLPANPFPTPTIGKNTVMLQEAQAQAQDGPSVLSGSGFGDQEHQEHGSKSNGSSRNGKQQQQQQEEDLVGAWHGNDDKRRRAKSRQAEGAPGIPREAGEFRSRGSGWPFSMGFGSGIYSAMRKMRPRKPVNDADADAQKGSSMPAAELAPAVGGDVSPDQSMEGSERAVDRMRELFAKSRAGGINQDSSTMRQESYYLRGKVEEVKDADFLDTIRQCIPGLDLVADVAMGETPTYGKKEVKLSSIGRHISNGSSSLSRAVRRGKDHGDSNGDARGSAENGPDADTDADADAPDGEEAALESKCVEWYGAIRVLVFVRKDLYKNLGVEAVVIPAGDKPSVVGDAPQDYAKDTSPDKGAVACYLRDVTAEAPLNLLLVNCHLCGTNKYGVPEDRFDQVRISQLKDIDRALKATLPCTAMGRLVLFGDLNFRVELCDAVEDKGRGGRDFKEVVQVAQDGEAKDLRTLYERADRLRALLGGNPTRGNERNIDSITGKGKGKGSHTDTDAGTRGATRRAQGEGEGGRRGRQTNGGHDGGGGDGDGDDGHCWESRRKRQPGQGHHQDQSETSGNPDFLRGLEDGLGVALAAGKAVRPTFTFKPRETSTPRIYMDKRTPSWTDRILWRGFKSPDEGGVRHEFASVPKVIISDHEPVYCLLGLTCDSAAT